MWKWIVNVEITKWSENWKCELMNEVLKCKVIKWKLDMGDGMVSDKIAEWIENWMCEMMKWMLK